MMEAKRSESVELPTNTIAAASTGVDRSNKPECTGSGKQGRTLIGAGFIGVGLAALCCAPPILAVLLPTIGLGAWLAGADRVLLLLLLVSFGIIALGLVRRQARTDACCETQTTKKRV